MKIIVSHDVDHLYVSDHLKRDLIIEKLWVRSLIHLLQRKIDGKTFWYRLLYPFYNKMHRMDEVMAFDREHGIPSVFFFGMDRALGMSYFQKQAKPFIENVMRNMFDVGVHGVNYEDINKIKKEHGDFEKLSGLKKFGIRNHYVRFDRQTFEKQNKAGYLFDSTWFNKKRLEIQPPYKVGDMWEFPLHIMDGYICKEGRLTEGLQKTYEAIDKAEKMGMKYCTILFHDYQFDDRFYPQMKTWYIETIKFCEEKGYPFISYREAIEELES